MSVRTPILMRSFCAIADVENIANVSIAPIALPVAPDITPDLICRSSKLGHEILAGSVGCGSETLAEWS
ncbi:hypothetical protein [Bradyrhizobium sp. 14AA]